MGLNLLLEFYFKHNNIARIEAAVLFFWAGGIIFKSIIKITGKKDKKPYHNFYFGNMRQ